jgi:hypothetical protein
MRDTTAVANQRDSLKNHAVRGLALTLVFSGGAVFEAVTLSSLHNADLWRHLRVGSWILDTRVWPHTGLFSQSAALPWRDFSWGYDVFAALVYRSLGLRALPALQMTFHVALAVLTFLLAGGRRRFWSAAAFSILVQYVLGTLGPTSEFCSVLFFALQLILIQKVRSSGDSRWTYLLPPLFVFWANCDIDFVFGIAVLILFVLSLLAEAFGASVGWSWAQQPRRRVPIKIALVAGFACLAASLVNPYGYQAYPAFLQTQADAINVNVSGHLAMGFQRPQDYLLLVLTMIAFLVLGLLRSRQLFPVSLLILCAVLAFHAERAGWLAALASVLVIGEATSQQNADHHPVAPCWSRRFAGGIASLTLLLCAAFFFLCVPANNAMLLARVADQFPVRACDYIREHQLPQPLFNDDQWGNFLTWYLPQYPVALDSRRGLYPEDAERDYAKVMKADLGYQDFPPMRQAQTLLLQKNSVMAEALRGLPGFQIVYEDALAIVFLQQSKDYKSASD